MTDIDLALLNIAGAIIFYFCGFVYLLARYAERWAVRYLAEDADKQQLRDLAEEMAER